MIKCVTGSYIL